MDYLKTKNDSIKYTDEQRLEIEQRFRESRKRMVFATITYFVFFFVSLYPLITSKSNTIRWSILALWVAGGIALWWYNRIYWRCPVCSKHWDLEQIFASAVWDYCPECGVPLTRTPREILTSTLSEERLAVLRHELRRRRRWRSVTIGLFVALVIVAGLFAKYKGLDRSATQILALTVGAVLCVVIFYLSRCLNCQKGLVMGARWCCPRCGILYR
jgi:di/tricarboxylate transporter